MSYDIYISEYLTTWLMVAYKLKKIVKTQSHSHISLVDGHLFGFNENMNKIMRTKKHCLH